MHKSLLVAALSFAISACNAVSADDAPSENVAIDSGEQEAIMTPSGDTNSSSPEGTLYSYYEGRFGQRYLPSHRFANVADASLQSVFSSGSTATPNHERYSVLFRAVETKDGCHAREQSETAPDNDFNAPLNYEYPLRFMENWKAMRFGSGAFFGPVRGIILDLSDNSVVGYIEQSQITQEPPAEPNTLFVVSSDSDDPFFLKLTHPAPEAYDTALIPITGPNYLFGPCQRVENISAEEFLAAHQSSIDHALGFTRK